MAKSYWDVREGTAMLIPPDVQRRFTNSSDEPLEMVMVEWPANAQARKDILVRDANRMPYCEENVHWNNMSKCLFSADDGMTGRVLLVMLMPFTMAAPHTHTQGTEEIWTKLTPGNAIMLLGSELREMPQFSAFLAPPNGVTWHAQVNTSKTQVEKWLYVAGGGGRGARQGGAPAPRRQHRPPAGAAVRRIRTCCREIRRPSNRRQSRERRQGSGGMHAPNGCCARVWLGCLRDDARAQVVPEPPSTTISNQHIRAKLWLPDAKAGFYRATRFDWSGVIASLEYAGHDFYDPWFSKSDPAVRDFAYQDADIVAGSVSAVTGPADEFQKPLGYDKAKPGETFVKIGVGVLRKPDDANYTFSTRFDLVDTGKWTVTTGNDFVTFIQDLADAASGYGYQYTKTIRLTDGAPEMVIEHTLRNTGSVALVSNVYNHNFLVLDQLAPGPDYVITLPFAITSTRPPAPAAATISGNQITYARTLEGQDRVSFPIQGFGPHAGDYDIRIENRRARAGVRVRGDRPLASMTLWSIRSVLTMEPFIDIEVDPGGAFTWRYDVNVIHVALR